MLPRKCRQFGEYILIAYCIVMMVAVLSIKQEVKQQVNGRQVDISTETVKSRDFTISRNGEVANFVKSNVSYSNIFVNKSSEDDSLRFTELQDDFPLSNGLVKPVPYMRIGRANPLSVVTIGVPTVRRGLVDYAINSVQSLFDNLSTREMESTSIVVFLGEENDEEYIRQRLHEFEKKFPEEIKSGNLEVSLKKTI